ncbi:MAG: hypothetical protein U5K75_10005 [Ahrensia sp.]|nr:hypothetical protein [Ahrensia sp.]
MLTQIDTDRLLDRVDVQVKFDGLDVKPQLNVLPVNLRRTYEAGEYVGFNATTNYASWISRQKCGFIALTATRLVQAMLSELFLLP